MAGCLSARDRQRKAQNARTFLLEQLLETRAPKDIDLPFSANTGYVNTIEPTQGSALPRQHRHRKRLRAYMRWNAMAMVVRANRLNPPMAATWAATVARLPRGQHVWRGLQPFWHAASENHGGDLLYIQGHSAPALRPRLLGRPPDRRTARQLPPGGGRQGLSSYPTPSSCPISGSSHRQHGPGAVDGDLPGAFPQIPARPWHANTENRKVWVFCGDGEMDEPESWVPSAWLRARAGQPGLRHQLQPAAPGWPVRSNGKIIQS